MEPVVLAVLAAAAAARILLMEHKVMVDLVLQDKAMLDLQVTASQLQNAAAAAVALAGLEIQGQTLVVMAA